MGFSVGFSDFPVGWRWVSAIFRWVDGGFPLLGHFLEKIGVVDFPSGETTLCPENPPSLRRIYRRSGESTASSENPQPLRRIHNVRQKIYQACGKSTNVSENPQLNRRNHNAPGKPPYAWRIHDRSGKSTAPTENPQSQQKIHSPHGKSTIATENPQSTKKPFPSGTVRSAPFSRELNFKRFSKRQGFEFLNEIIPMRAGR